MKSSAILKFLLSTLLFAAITGCSSDKSPRNLYLYEGIERFGVKHCNDTLLVIAYYGVGEKDTMTLYPKNGGYYRRRGAFGEQLILAVKDFPQDTVYYHKSARLSRRARNNRRKRKRTFHFLHLFILFERRIPDNTD